MCHCELVCSFEELGTYIDSCSCMHDQIIPQHAGQAIHVPSEAVHQVWNLQDHVKVVYDYLMPDRLHKYVRSQLEVHRRMFCLDAAWPDDYMAVYDVTAIEMRMRGKRCPAFKVV